MTPFLLLEKRQARLFGRISGFYINTNKELFMKTRKTLLCGVFAALLALTGAGMAFAQEGQAAASNEKKNAVALDTIPLY